MLVATQSHDTAWEVRVPYEDIKVEAAANNDLVLLTVSHLTHSSLMACESLDWVDDCVTKGIISHGVIFEVRLDLRFLLLLGGFFFGSYVVYTACVSTVSLFLVLSQVIQVNFAIVNSCCQLVDIWQKLNALDEVKDKPGGVLCAISNVLFPLLVTSHLFVSTAWPSHQRILVRHVVRISWLQLIVY